MEKLENRNSNEAGYLPVFELKGLIINYFENAYPSFIEHIKLEVKFNDLKPNIIYDNRKHPASHAAEMSSDRQITIFEPYIAYIWCLSYAIAVFSRQKDIDYDSEPSSEISIAIETLSYGNSLLSNWQPWPKHLPKPASHDPNNPHIGEADALTSISMSYILSHEFGHHYLGHSLDGTVKPREAKEEEFIADRFACETIMAGLEVGNLPKNTSIEIAIILGLGSILLASSSWDGGEEHPETNERLKRIIDQIDPDPSSDAWKWGILMLMIWGITYKKELIDPHGNGSTKKDFEFLERQFS